MSYRNNTCKSIPPLHFFIRARGEPGNEATVWCLVSKKAGLPVLFSVDEVIPSIHWLLFDSDYGGSFALLLDIPRAVE